MYHEHAVGSYVEIQTEDGSIFSGVLQDFTDDYVVLNGYGFPLDDIEEMWPA